MINPLHRLMYLGTLSPVDGAFRNVMEPLQGGAFLEKDNPSKWAWVFYSPTSSYLSLLPVCRGNMNSLCLLLSLCLLCLLCVFMAMIDSLPLELKAKINNKSFFSSKLLYVMIF